MWTRSKAPQADSLEKKNTVTIPRSRLHKKVLTVAAVCGLSFPNGAYVVNCYIRCIPFLMSNVQILCVVLFMYVRASAQLMEVGPLVLSV